METNLMDLLRAVNWRVVLAQRNIAAAMAELSASAVGLDPEEAAQLALLEREAMHQVPQTAIPAAPAAAAMVVVAMALSRLQPMVARAVSRKTLLPAVPEELPA